MSFLWDPNINFQKVPSPDFGTLLAHDEDNQRTCSLKNWRLEDDDTLRQIVPLLNWGIVNEIVNGGTFMAFMVFICVHLTHGNVIFDIL